MRPPAACLEPRWSTPRTIPSRSASASVHPDRPSASSTTASNSSNEGSCDLWHLPPTQILDIGSRPVGISTQAVTAPALPSADPRSPRRGAGETPPRPTPQTRRPRPRGAAGGARGRAQWPRRRSSGSCERRPGPSSPPYLSRAPGGGGPCGEGPSAEGSVGEKHHEEALDDEGEDAYGLHPHVRRQPKIPTVRLTTYRRTRWRPRVLRAPIPRPSWPCRCRRRPRPPPKR